MIRKGLKLAVSSVMFGALFVSGVALADGMVPMPAPCKCGSYVRADAGYSWPASKVYSKYSNSNTTGAFVGAFGAGYIVNNHVRSDVTATQRSTYNYSATSVTNGPIKQDIDSTALMASAYVSPKPRKITPYVMAGAGVSLNTAGDIKYPNKGVTCAGDWSRNFAWQVGVGALFKIEDKWYADLMFKYVDLGKIDSQNCCYGVTVCKSTGGSNPDGKLRVYDVTIGIVYKF